MTKSFRNSRLTHIAGLLLAVFVWLANAGNPPTARTGAPFDDGSCNDCHSGGNFSGTIEVTGMPGTVQPNMTYPLTVTMTPTGGSPVRGGFQLVAVANDNSNCGNLTNSNAQSGTEFSMPGREYLEQRNPKNFGGNPISWDFTWASPSSVPGNTIKFYMIGNFANGNGGTSGDNAITALETYTFSGPPPVTVSITSSTNVSCFGGNNGSATAEADGGTPPYTYKWSGSTQTSATVTNLTAGTYTVTATGSGGSGTATATVVITQPPVITLSTTVSGSINCINNSVDVTANPGGGVGGFSFAWSNSETGNPATYINPGTGSVVATDANGCTKTATFTITSSLTPPAAAASSTSAFTCTTPSIALSGTGSSTGSNFSYLWSAGPGGSIVSGGTTLTPTVTGCATYTLQVSNISTGCTSTASVTPNCDVVPPNASATGATITCTTTTVTISGNSTTPGVTYTWVGPGGFTSNLQNTSVSTSGTYTVTVRNPANNCTATATATVTPNTTPPNATATGGTLTCATTTVTISGNSTTPGVTYAWGGPNSFTSNLQNPSVSAPGTYTVTVTNPTNGCTATATATVGQNVAAPNASATGATLTCAATTVTLLGNSTTPGAIYMWTGPNGPANTQNLSVSVPGVYTLKVTDPVNGCTTTATATALQNSIPPNASASGGILTCTATTVTISGNSTTTGATYAWVGPNNFTSNLQNPSVAVVGTYTLTVSDPANGCTATATATVGQNITPPNDSITPPPHFNCLNDTITIDASASSQGAIFDYAWTARNGGHIVSGDTTLTPRVDSAGRYILLITNTLNGCTTLDSVDVTQTPPVMATATATNVSCFGGSNGTATATGGGGNGAFSFAWSNSDTSATITGLSAGSYVVSVTDADGCTASATATVTQPTALAANATATGQTAVGINDGTATAAPTGGTTTYTYLWSNNGTSATITGLAPGNYTVVVTDANGCSAVQVVTVNAFGCNLALTAGSTNVTCNGAADGTAWVNVNGANLPIGYAWSNQANTQTINNLTPGAYTVTVMDAANCQAVQSVNVSEPPALQANATATGQTGVGLNDGTATSAPTGGTAPITFLWNTGATTASISNLAPGIYTVVVTDAQACTTQQSVTVTAFNCNLTLSLTTINPTCFGLNNGSVTASVTGATGGVNYVWSTGATTATISNLPGGDYTVIVTDAANCMAFDTVGLQQPTALMATVSDVVNVDCPLNSTGSAVVTVTGGTQPYTYIWPGGSNGTGLQAGTYSVTIADANACFVTTAVVIASLDTQVPTISCPGNIVVCGADLITYSVPATEDNCTPKPLPVLVSGQASGTPFLDGVTTQVFRATDLSGNSATCSFSVTVHPIPDVKVTDYTNDTNGLGLGYIKIQVLGGTQPFVFVWYKDNVFFSNEEDLDNLSAGAYRLVMTDANGCVVNQSPLIIQNTVGINEPWQIAGLRLWPNPTRDAFRLEANGLEIATAQVLTPQGRLVQNIEPAELSGEVSVAQLPAGLYYLRIITQQGWQAMVKWVKSE